MHQGMSEIIHRLKTCFPGGCVNFNNEFIAHRHANRQYGSACCSLRNCTIGIDVICAVIESFSYDCCKSRPFNTGDANISFRIFMVTGMNEFLGTSFTESDFCTIYSHLGCGVNRNLTVAFVNSGYDLKVLTAQKKELLVSVETLLDAINGVEYRARTLEQMRGGNDVLRKLLPKLIASLQMHRVLPVVHCDRCEYWKPNDNEVDDYGKCKRYGITKHCQGYCDFGKLKTDIPQDEGNEEHEEKITT